MFPVLMHDHETLSQQPFNSQLFSLHAGFKMFSHTAKITVYGLSTYREKAKEKMNGRELFLVTFAVQYRLL
jgi:hypothetical protein